MEIVWVITCKIVGNIHYPKVTHFHLPKVTSFYLSSQGDVPKDSTLGSDMVGFQPEEFMQKITK